jgi:prepilin-type N-terminal cleavage/methylation domain-containing protein
MNHQNHRCGYTLIEMLLSITVATVLLGVNVGWIHQTMKFASVTKQRQRQQQSLTRLAWEFRDDVRAGNSIAMVGEDQLVIKSADGGQATYTISGSELLVEKTGDQPMVKRERFELARNATAVWDTSEMPDWISLVVYRGGESLELESDRNSESPTPVANPIPADLHVRVGPNRWKTQWSDATLQSPSQEEAK